MNIIEFNVELNRVKESVSNEENKRIYTVELSISGGYTLNCTNQPLSREDTYIKLNRYFYDNRNKDFGALENAEIEKPFSITDNTDTHTAYTAKISGTGKFEFVTTKEKAEEEMCRLANLYPCGYMSNPAVCIKNYVFKELDDRQAEKEFTFENSMTAKKAFEEATKEVEIDFLSAISEQDPPTPPAPQTSANKNDIMEKRVNDANELTKNIKKSKDDYGLGL